MTLYASSTLLFVQKMQTFWILTLILLTWRLWWANNAWKLQMGFNSAFKELNLRFLLWPEHFNLNACCRAVVTFSDETGVYWMGQCCPIYLLKDSLVVMPIESEKHDLFLTYILLYQYLLLWFSDVGSFVWHHDIWCSWTLLWVQSWSVCI
jgi:hypothetical protein